MTTRPQEIRQPRVYGNFRPTLAERAKKKPSAQQRREGNDRKHLEFLRRLPCCVTLKMPAGSVHHLKSGPAKKERGVGMKATDRWGVPLSEGAHIFGVELLGSRNELAWFKANGIADPYGLAEALWHARGDLGRMTAIVLAHRGQP